MVRTDDQTPATKADVHEIVHKVVQGEVLPLKQEIGGLKNRLDTVEHRLDTLDVTMNTQFDELTRYIGVQFEQYHHDTVGIMKDFVADLKQTDNDHERRIRRLETKMAA